MRYIWFVCICLIIAVGGNLSISVTNDPRYEYDLRDYKAQLNDIREQLDTIALHLKSYYAKNGMYPDNNEGLMALTDLREILIRKRDDLPPPMGTLTNTDLADGTGFSYKHRLEMVSFEGGILSPRFEPYVYENRRNLPEELFVDSPVNQDKEQGGSVKVDEGIYVYSCGSVISYKKYAALLAEIKMMGMLSLGIIVVSLILIVVFILLFIKAKRPEQASPKRWLKILKAIGGSILVLFSIGITGTHTRVMCYARGYNEIHSRPMSKEYANLLEKYHQRGVINDATYQKTKTALDQVDKLIEDKKLR